MRKSKESPGTGRCRPGLGKLARLASAAMMFGTDVYASSSCFLFILVILEGYSGITKKRGKRLREGTTAGPDSSGVQSSGFTEEETKTREFSL